MYYENLIVNPTKTKPLLKLTSLHMYRIKTVIIHRKIIT